VVKEIGIFVLQKSLSSQLLTRAVRKSTPSLFSIGFRTFIRLFLRGLFPVPDPTTSPPITGNFEVTTA
jgi:hypothetical protein